MGTDADYQVRSGDASAVVERDEVEDEQRDVAAGAVVAVAVVGLVVAAGGVGSR